MCLKAKLTFGKCIWKLDYSIRRGGKPEFVILMSWWCHGIPGYKVYNYFLKGLLSVIPTFAYQKIPSKISFQRALQAEQWAEQSAQSPSGRKNTPQIGPGISSGLTFHGFHSGQLHKGGSKGEGGSEIGKGTQTEDRIALCPTNTMRALTSDLFGAVWWRVMKKSVKTGNDMYSPKHSTLIEEYNVNLFTMLVTVF